MLIELTKSHFGSLSQNVPEVKLQNLYIVENPLSLTNYSYVTRPVVTSFSDLGDDIRGVYFQQGFVGDEIVVVSGNRVLLVADDGTFTQLGTVDGDGPCKFASTIYGICVVSGDFTYIYDGTELNLVAIPDDLLVEDVTSLNNYFILSMRDQNKFYWVLPGEITIDALSFASAESNPDDIVSVRVISDELWIIGKTTTEVWAPSDDPNAPFQRIAGRIFNKGCVSDLSVTPALLKGSPCLLWVTNNREVVLAQGLPNKISNDFIEEMLRNSTYFYGWYFSRHRNDFYVLTTDIITVVFDLTNQIWYKWVTNGQNNFKISQGVQKETSLYGVDLLNSGTLFKLIDGTKDETDDWLICEVTGVVQYNEVSKSLPCSSVKIIANTGFSSNYGIQPIIEMRWSDDQGANWSNYSQATLGDRGDTSYNTSFRSLGQIKIPGRRFEFRFSGTELFRLDYVVMNDGVQ